MDAVLPFVPDRFQSTVPFYVAHRLRYPDALIEEIANRVGLAPPGRVLDLGCGPGFLAIAFARHAGEVVGMDPDAAMLAAARSEASGVTPEPRFVQGSSYDLSPAMGPFRLVTMGRSFHWMDRTATLAMLDQIVEPEGGVATFADRHEKCRENGWAEVVEKVQRDFVGASASQQMRRDPEWDSHAAVMLRSPFCRVEAHSIIERRPLTAEDIVGRALSMSATAPQVLGDRLEAFRAALAAELRVLSPSGEFHEIVAHSAILARRARD